MTNKKSKNGNLLRGPFSYLWLVIVIAAVLATQSGDQNGQISSWIIDHFKSQSKEG